MFFARAAKGFTLIELVVVIAILSIAITIAIPSFVYVTKNNQVQEISSEIYNTLAYARSEAITRNTTITVKAGSDENTGWLETITISTPSETLRKIERKTSLNQLTSSSSSTSIDFKPSGTVKSSSSISICSSSDIKIPARIINISMSGNITSQPFKLNKAGTGKCE